MTDEEFLIPEILAIGTTRQVRVRRVGRVFFVENLRQSRALGPDGAEVVKDEWVPVAVAKGGDDPRHEAMIWLADANVKIAEASRRA